MPPCFQLNLPIKPQIWLYSRQANLSLERDFMLRKPTPGSLLQGAEVLIQGAALRVECLFVCQNG